MKRIGTAIMAAALAFVLAGCDITPGGACSAENSKHTNENGYSYTCKSLINPDGTPGKRIWQQDAPLTPDRP